MNNKFTKSDIDRKLAIYYHPLMQEMLTYITMFFGVATIK